MRFTNPDVDELSEMAGFLRATDRREAQASHGLGAREALLQSWGASTVRFGIEGDDGQLVGACGVCPDAGAGQIWMLGTDQLLATTSHRIQLVRRGREWVDALLDDWRLLHNYVFAANTQSVAWLRFMGFTVYPAEPHGPYAQLFRYFLREAS
jgi:hypothetical protein